MAAAKIIPITSDDEIDDFVVEVNYLFLIGFFDGCAGRHFGRMPSYLHCGPRCCILLAGQILGMNR